LAVIVSFPTNWHSQQLQNFAAAAVLRSTIPEKRYRGETQQILPPLGNKLAMSYVQFNAFVLWALHMNVLIVQCLA